VHKVRVDVVLRLRTAAGLVRVVEGGEAAEAGLDVAVGRVEGDAQVRVEGAGALEVVVGFVDGVEEVEGDDGDVDAPAVGGEARGAWLGLGVAGADGDAVVEGLGPGCYELLLRGGLVPGKGRDLRVGAAGAGAGAEAGSVRLAGSSSRGARQRPTWLLAGNCLSFWCLTMRHGKIETKRRKRMCKLNCG
jgi:hypothetical protein